LILLSFLRAGLGFARGGILHALYSMTSLLAPLDRKGGMMGIAASLTVLGNMIGPLSGGMIAGQAGLTIVFGVNSLLLLLCSLIVWKYYVEKPIHDHINEDAEQVATMVE